MSLNLHRQLPTQDISQPSPPLPHLRSSILPSSATLLLILNRQSEQPNTIWLLETMHIRIDFIRSIILVAGGTG